MINLRYPDRIMMTVSIPIAFICRKSASHSFSPQFWWGMSWDISSRKVPVIFNALFLGTMSLLRISSVGVSSLLELQEDNHDGNVMAAALANTDFFRNSLRLLLFIFSGFSIWILLFILVIGNCLYS